MTVGIIVINSQFRLNRQFNTVCVGEHKQINAINPEIFIISRLNMDC